MISALAWLILVHTRHNAEFWLVISALVTMVFAFVLTAIVNFPINDQLMTWSPMAPPRNFRETWSPWEKAHKVRTVLWIAAFVCEAVALVVFASPTG